MNAILTLPMMSLIGFCIITEALSQLCFKQAASAPTFAQTLQQPVTWLGIALWMIEVIAWANVLEFVPVTIAFPLMALTYVTTLVAGAWVFKEHVNTHHAIGALLITAGVACVGATGL